MDSNGENFSEKRRKSLLSTTSGNSEENLHISRLQQLRKNLLQKANNNAPRNTMNSNQLTEAEVKTITSLLPDEVIHHTTSDKLRSFEAVVILADISGFTDLSDKYQQQENGASKLSMVLNFYLGSMVQEILSHRGDIIKFAGDAFIAIFRGDNCSSMPEAFHTALETSLFIQKNCKDYFVSEVGVTLNVKIAISCGEVFFSLIGNKQSSNYVIVGDPVWNVKSLQDRIKPGEVLVTSKAWLYAQESQYVYEFNPDRRFYRVTDFKNNLLVVQRQQEAILDFYVMRKKMQDDGSVSDFQDASNDGFSSATDGAQRNETYMLRQTMSANLNNQSRAFLKSFIIKPLLRSIEADESIELLTEMRNVVIVFANFVVRKSKSEEIVELVNGIYKTLSGIVANYEGVVNKVSLFDKDMMFLIVFGLRGLKHQLEQRTGLRCAAALHKTFKTWRDVKTMSVGVTTGMTYCGVVGHSLRREYTVISLTVNKAARLMMAYPGIVSTDQETLLISKMDLWHFTILPKRKLKGLSEEVIAYEFKEIVVDVELKKPVNFDFKILGRDDVLSTATTLLTAAITNHNRQQHQKDVTVSWFVVKGETQQGKTRVLNQIFANCIDDKLDCLHLTLTVTNSNFSHQTMIKRFLLKAWNLSEDESDKAVQEVIAEKLEAVAVDEYFCLLNPLFNTPLERTATVKAMTKEDKALMTKAILKILITRSFDRFLVIFVDDFEYFDATSFEFLDIFLELSSVFMFLGLGDGRKLAVQQKEVISGPRVAYHRLAPIDEIHQSDIACHCLNVSVLSPELEKYLHDNSNGNPGWIQTCMSSLLQAKKLQIVSMSIDEVYSNGLTPNDTKRRLKDDTTIDYEHAVFDQIFKGHEDISPRKSLDQIVQVAMFSEDVSKTPFPANTGTDKDLMTYDSLSSYEQLVCKCASALGVNFTRKMLAYVMASSTDRMIGIAIVRLFELNIVTCTSTMTRDQPMKVKKSSEIVACCCANLKIIESCRNLPKFSCCASMRFVREEFQNVVYATLTEKQRLEYHRKCLIFLHVETRRCDSCKRERFPELMLEDFDFKFRDGILYTEDSSHQMMLEFCESMNFPMEQESKCKFFSKPVKQPKPIVLNYMSYDFRHCKCNEILSAMYNEMIRHCLGGDTDLKLIETKVEFAGICIKTSNLPRAKLLLERALWQLDHLNFDDTHRFPDFLRGKALTLQGQCAACMQHYQKAIKLYRSACEVLAVSFPKSYTLMSRIKLEGLIRSIKNSLSQEKAPQFTRMFGLVTTQLAKTMKLMFDQFLLKKQYDLAKLAAFWSLRNALKYERKLPDVAAGFANVLKIAFLSGSAADFLWLQKASLTTVARTLFNDDVNLEGLTAVSRLYYGLVLCQISTNCRYAEELGKLTESLCYQTQQTSFQTEIVPRIFQILLNAKRIDEAQKLLDRFSRTMKTTYNYSGLIWYHALCMDLLIDTSFSIVSYEACYQFYMDEITTFTKDSDVEARSRFYANLWLWNVRQKDFMTSRFWMEKLSACFELETKSSMNNVFTGLRVMEALSLQLEFAIEHGNTGLSLDCHKRELKALIKKLGGAIKINSCFVERFALLKLYSELIIKFDGRKVKKLDNLMGMALKNRNYLLFDIIKHTQRSWRNELSSVNQNFWHIHNFVDNSVNISDFPFIDRIFPFSLPLAKSGKESSDKQLA